MTAFDIAVLVVVGLSVVFAFVRGFVREIFAIASWILALYLAFHFSAAAAAWIPGQALGPAGKQVAAFLGVLLLALLLGGWLTALLARLVHAVGLGLFDRLLGAVFGFARGALLVLIGVLIAGLTTLPRNPWWQNAALAKPVVAAALGLSGWLPRAWADRLDFSGHVPSLKKRGAAV